MNYGTFQFDNAHKIIELGYQNAKDNAKLIASFPKYKTQELEKDVKTINIRFLLYSFQSY